MKKVRTRIAPSPTGDPHVGTAYMALFNIAFAKHFGGDFILRIEDTDQKRSDPEYEQNIYRALKWMGLDWDEGPDKGGAFGPYRQSERLDIYKKYVQKLLDEGKAYKCFATPEELVEMREVAAKTGKRIGYDRRYRNLSEKEVNERIGRGEKYVVRLKVPLTGECVFEDAIKGKIVTPWADIDDQVLLKSDGFPTYHMAVVVDDYLMNITHVIRGDEWISSTPKHVLLYDSFGWEKPVFLHMPLLLGKDGRKLSKRRNPTSIFYYRDSGFLPEALLNFLSLMGYSMPGDKEIYDINELIKDFDPTRIGLSGAFFDIKKLEWLNQKYLINKLDDEKLLEALKKWSLNDEFLKKLIPLGRTRIKTFGEFFELFDFMFINHLPYKVELFTPQETKPIVAAYVLQAIIWFLDEAEDWRAKSLESASHEVATHFGLNHKKVVMPILFAAVMGKLFGPSLFEAAEILGKERLRARFLNSIELLGPLSNKDIEKLKSAWDKNRAKCCEIINKI